jgi:tripartite ATP-independent transporter DctP family solute receptor
MTATEVYKRKDFKMKKSFLWVLILILSISMFAMFTFAGCNKGGAVAAEEEEEGEVVVAEEEEEEEEEVEEKATYGWKLAETHPEDYATTLADKEFARLVWEKSNGRINIEVYANKLLGEEKTAVEQVQLGSVEFTRVSLAVPGAFVPAMNALQLPYLYRDADHMWKVLKGDIGQGLLEKMKEGNFIGLCYYDGGTRSFYTKNLVENVADMKGLKIRVMQNPLFVGMIEMLDGIATPLPYADVYSALQTGTIDGAENNWSSYLTTGHYEHAPYYIIDGHLKVPEILMMSKIIWDELSTEDQQILMDAAAESVDFQIEKWNASEMNSRAALEAIETPKITITEIDAATKAEFAEKMLPLYDQQYEENPDMEAVVDAVKAVQ